MPQAINTREASSIERPKAINLAAVVTGVLTAYMVALVFLVLGAALIHYTTLSEQLAPHMVFMVTLVSLLLGAWIAGKKATSRGWLNGGLVGFIYVISLILLGILFLENIITVSSIVSKIFLGIAISVFGGVWGVNSS